jgi:sugar lactone lactonase YvrE
MHHVFLALPALLGAIPGCTDDLPDDPCPTGIPVLGCGAESADAVTIDVVGDRGDGLDVPRDLAFTPDHPGELWTVNRGDDSVVIFFDAGTEDQHSQHIVDPYAEHFMEEVSSIAFGAEDRFATCQESRNTYDHVAPADDFMGPALWSSDLDVFGHSNPEAIEDVGFDLGSHLDMLHESPNCMGIAWEEDNVYWVFDGHHDAIVRYDFQEDHGAGYDDHSDGIIGRYVEGEVDRRADIPSHLVFDHDTDLLYIADTGNRRIAALDTRSGERGEDLPVQEPGTDHYQVEDAHLETLIDEEEGDLRRPSGLALWDGVLYVTDYDSGVITAFTRDGEMIDRLPTGREEALMGIEVDGEGNLWVVDADRDEVLHIAAAADLE